VEQGAQHHCNVVRIVWALGPKSSDFTCFDTLSIRTLELPLHAILVSCSHNVTTHPLCSRSLALPSLPLHPICATSVCTVWLKQVCRQLHALITMSLNLQYCIKLAAEGLVDGPPIGPASMTVEWMDLLLEWCVAWHGICPRWCATLVLVGIYSMVWLEGGSGLVGLGLIASPSGCGIGARTLPVRMRAIDGP